MGEKRLSGLRRKWRAEAVLYCLLLGLAISLVPATAGHVLAGWSWWAGGGVFVVVCGVVMWVIPLWRIHLTDIAIYLDRSLPLLEESCGLLLKPDAEMSEVQRWQARRVMHRLEGMSLPRPFSGRLWRALGWWALAAALSVAVGWAGRRNPEPRLAGFPVARGGGVSGVGLDKADVSITPPAYTGRAVRHQTDLNVQVEEGAVVEWELQTNSPADSVGLLFGTATWLPMKLAASGKRLWSAGIRALHPGFYQLKIGGRWSGLYKFGITQDEPPQVLLRKPKGYTMIDFGESLMIPLEMQVADDYGIADASVMVTVSSGSGEAVKFKERELRWERRFGATRYELKKTLDLGAMGLKPGDELYLYGRARDNHEQETRTPTFIISLADTARLMNLDGMVVPTDVRPEFFRSERQIIIETEQLLHQQDTMAVSVFKDRSNSLGIDQKLLRLRYGKFLGEEAEEGRPDLDTADPGAFGDATKILDVYTDKHDNAEDATYFEPVVKQQLRATLSEMWGAELKLRTFKPREALPFCYKALRLLKDLQQQSRTYVAKTGTRAEPLNPSRRLTGDLGAIRPRERRVGQDEKMTEEDQLRMALAVLEGMRTGVEPGHGGRWLLEGVEQRLAEAASANPAEWLAAYAAMKRISGPEDIRLVEQAVMRLLPGPEPGPSVRRDAADGGISRKYFNYLKE
jgi:hypothetical protein